MGPQQIRAIRGGLSRAAFGRLLGVTALTVLRWELPSDSKEARRPRAKMIEALERLASEGVEGVKEPTAVDEDEDDEDASEPVSAEPSALEELDADELLLAPLLDRLNSETWQHAEDELLSRLASGTLGNTGRHLATLGVVQTRVLARMDTRTALAALLPVLHEAEQGLLSRGVAARTHVMAAVLFSQPDSRLFDPGRINAHAARAEQLLREHDDDLHALLATARLAATRFLGADVTSHVYQGYGDRLQRASSPLAVTLAEGVHAVVATDRNDTATAMRHGAKCLAGAEALKLWGMTTSIMADYAARSLRAAQPPEGILETTRQGKEKAMGGALPPTEPLIRLFATECEALCRLARFDEAARTAAEALALATRGGVARYPLTGPLGRLYVFTSRIDELESLAEAFEQESLGTQQLAAGLHAAYLRALLASLRGDYGTAIELCEQVCGVPETTPGLEYLLHDAQFELTVSHVLSNELERAAAQARRAEALIERRPSVWHSAMFRRAESLMLMQQGRMVEARQKIESTRATFRLLGDVLQEALEDAGLALVAKASAAPEAPQLFAAAMAHLEGLGVGTTFLRQRAEKIVPPAQPTWREQTIAEKLLIAMERLGVRGLSAEAFERELLTVLTWLFPGREAKVSSGEIDAAWGEVVDASSAAVPLRFALRGEVDPEQRAVLHLLRGFVTRSAAQLGPAAEPEPALDGLLPGFVAVSKATRHLKQEIARLSRSNATILISGESGSGKEVVARAVHDLSLRSDKPYLTFNCASVPRELFESQLFGHRKGAFTGAVSDNLGVIRAADGGTLFLDEIGELPLETQPKLLRFLENAEVLPVGEQRPRRVNVRVLSATHRDLGRLVSEGGFREDLYYRLNVVPIRVPALRERREDIAALARLFISRLCADGQAVPTIGPDAVRALESHAWPGNVRELRNVIERAMAYAPVPSLLSRAHLRM
jgi:transcriptional regulator with XRE-family HTH domain/predicted ATP-dependent protease